MYNVSIESYAHIQAHHENCDAACVANSGRETEDITQELHPPVASCFGAEPLVASGRGRMEFCFHVVGALVGFKYRIVLLAVDILVHRVIQQQEIRFSPTDDSAFNEITAELDVRDSTKTDSIKFAIGVWDAHAGLSEEEALVARKDATFPLITCEHALTTDNVKGAFSSTPLVSEARMQEEKERKTEEGRHTENEHEHHGEKHPPVTLAFGTEPLVSTRAREMILRFHLRGVVVGFRYRIIVQEMRGGTAQVDQQESLVHCVDDDSPASSEVTVELALYDEFQKDFRFAIVAYDAHEGLTDEEAIVARRDGTFPLVRKGSRISASAGEAGHDNEQGAQSSISSSLETHTFVFEQPPEPQKGYGAVR
jgi:hypothetical protein